MMRIGMTGHQHLDDPEDWVWVEATIRSELAQRPAPFIAVTSLAIGADQLFAKLIVDEGGSLYTVLPYRDIERSFQAKNLPAYRKLVNQSTVEVLATPGSDEDAYLAAGHRVVDLSDLMLAVWNGKPAVGKGGTADVVSYAKRKSVPLIHIDPVARVVHRFHVG